jgi:hypothetical protein
MKDERIDDVPHLPHSIALCDEARDTRFHYLVEPLPGLNAIDFVQRILQKRGDVKILSRAARIWVW